MDSEVSKIIKHTFIPIYLDLVCLAIFGKFYQSQEAGQDSAQTGKAHAQKDTNWERISDLFIRVFDITVTHYNSNINNKNYGNFPDLKFRGTEDMFSFIPSL